MLRKNTGSLLESTDALRVALWFKVSIKVLQFVFRRMNFQLVKSLPSYCEIPSIHSAAPEGVVEVVQHPRALCHGTVPAPVGRTVFSRCGTGGKGAVFHGWWLLGAERRQGACCLF